MKVAIGLLIAFVILAGVGLLFSARPTPILGVDDESLAHSVEKNPRFDKCQKSPGNEWICAIDGDGPPTRYRVDVGWDGCWKGEQVAGPVSTHTPNEISGCIQLWDHLRLEEALN